MAALSPARTGSAYARISRKGERARRFPAAWAAAAAAWAAAEPMPARRIRPTVGPNRSKSAAALSWYPGLIAAGVTGALTAFFVVGSSLFGLSDVAAASRPQGGVTRSAAAQSRDDSSVVLASTARAPRAVAATETPPGNARVPPAVATAPTAATNAPSAASRAAPALAGPSRSGLAGIFDAPPALSDVPAPAAPSPEKEAEEWSRQVAAVVGDALTPAETGCIGAAARAGLADDPSLWGPAFAGDLEALRPFGDRVARGCGVAPARLAPVVERALAQWGPSPGSRSIGAISP